MATKKKSKPRNRAAQDATLINIRKLKRDIAEIGHIQANLVKRLGQFERAKFPASLSRRLDDLEQRVSALWSSDLDRRVMALETPASPIPESVGGTE